MDALFPPYRVQARFGGRSVDAAFPVPWAVSAPSLREARKILAMVRRLEMPCGQVVARPDGRVYVRWLDWPARCLPPVG